jgi:cell wall-associated NlpC family hydrolase
LGTIRDVRLRPTLALVPLVAALMGCASEGTRSTSDRAQTPPTKSIPEVTVEDGPSQASILAPPKRRAAKKKPKIAPLPPPVADPKPSEAISPGAPSDAEVRRELRLALGIKGKGPTGSLTNSAQITADGLAVSPLAAPAAVDAVIRGGNRVAHAPYIYGGGHGRWEDTGYDCSGSVSFALASAGLLNETLDSTRFEKYGDPGPGKWITIYANAGHAFMYVAGLRFDTSGRNGPHGSRWQTASRSVAGFVQRHPPGL